MPGPACLETGPLSRVPSCASCTGFQSFFLEYLFLAGKPPAGKGAKEGSTAEPVFRVGALQSLDGFPLGLFIPLFPAQADLDR